MKIFAKVFLTFFLYILISYFLVGVSTKPTEGDSLNYHIPIAQTILNGQFLHPSNFLYYYPSTGEAILSLFIFLNLPLSLFNIFGVVLLFFAVYLLGLRYGLKKESAIICAVSICTLHLTVRWLLTQKIDIWLAVFFVNSLALIQKPKKSAVYFLMLGISLGLLMGTKFTAPFFSFVLLMIFGKNLLNYISWRRFFSFLVPFSFLGFFWYIRNFIAAGNPFYPQPLYFLKGNSASWDIVSSSHVWEAIIHYPMQMMNAFFGDYVVWSILILALILVFTFFSVNVKSNLFEGKLKILMFLGLINTGFYLFLPANEEYHMMVSSLRYSYPAFIPFILSIFLIAQKHKKEEFLFLLAFASMLTLPSLNYHPKLLFILIPLMIFFVFFDLNTIYKNIKKLFT